MPPITVKATAATLAGVLNTISSLSGGSNGSAVTDFNDKSQNMLPPLPGSYKVGVAPVDFRDFDHHELPLCDVSNDEIPDAACLRPRLLTTSLFYPACPPSDNQGKPVLLGEEHFAPVFTPTVLGEIFNNAARTGASTAAGDFAGLHNLMSQAVSSAPACKGQYPLTVFAPDAGGQRQAYTQVASELASMGHVVLTMDSPFLSGVVQVPSDGAVELSLYGDWVDRREGFIIKNNDLQSIHKQLATANERLGRLPFWTNETSVQLDHCIFGHGSSGRIAQMMVDTHVINCGGPLEGILTLPAPFTGDKKAATSRPSVSGPPATDKRPPSSPHDLPQTSSLDFRPILLEGLQLLQHLRDKTGDIFEQVVCRLEGTCGTQKRSDSISIEKRNVGDDPWYYPKYPYHRDPYYDDDYGYGDHKDGYGHDGYDDKWDDHYDYDYDCDDHYEDDYYPPYYPSKPYPSKPYPPKPYPPYPYPSRPFPPPGIFPPNMTWPPYGKLPYGNTPWDDHWNDYPNSGIPYGPKYGHKDCDHYYGGYPIGYEDHGDDYDCDGYPDHYRVWDKKQYCHGWVDDYYDDDYDHKDDYDHHGDDYDDHDCEDHDDDYDEDYDKDYDEDHDDDDYDHHGDCGKDRHHHGDVDDYDDDKGDDYGEDHDKHDDHGYVDDWDDKDHA